jgi:N utilization substance protein A
VRLAAKLTGWNIDVRSDIEKRRKAEVADTTSVLPCLIVAEAVEVLPACTPDNLEPVDMSDGTIVKNIASEGCADVTSLNTM